MQFHNVFICEISGTKLSGNVYWLCTKEHETATSSEDSCFHVALTVISLDVSMSCTHM